MPLSRAVLRLYHNAVCCRVVYVYRLVFLAVLVRVGLSVLVDVCRFGIIAAKVHHVADVDGCDLSVCVPAHPVDYCASDSMPQLLQLEHYGCIERVVVALSPYLYGDFPRL